MHIDNRKNCPIVFYFEFMHIHNRTNSPIVVFPKSNRPNYYCSILAIRLIRLLFVVYAMGVGKGASHQSWPQASHQLNPALVLTLSSNNYTLFSPVDFASNAVPISDLQKLPNLTPG